MRLAPCAKSSSSPSGKVRNSGATATSAKPPSMLNAATRSPGCTGAPSGALRTTPPTSLPGMNGRSGLTWYWPRVWSTSGNETPAAWTSTTTPRPGVSRWEGSGSGASTSSRASSGPLRLAMWMALMWAGAYQSWRRGTFGTERAMSVPLLPSDEEARRLAPKPRSVAWCYAGDARTMLGAGSALLLQVAHPTVAAGVRDHSNFAEDPWGRLLRTLDFVNLVIYGGPDAAARTGRRLREMHKHIKGVDPDGRRYHALEPEAYAWVHATLAETIVRAHRRFGVPMSPTETEIFWREWRGVGRLLGIRERDLPLEWHAFRAYVGEMIATRLEPNDVVEDVLASLQAPVAPPLPPAAEAAWRALRVPAARAGQLGTVGLLPSALRRKLGLTMTARDRAELRVLGAVLRSATPLMPSSLRQMGPGYLRWRREEIAAGEFGTGARAAAA